MDEPTTLPALDGLLTVLLYARDGDLDTAAYQLAGVGRAGHDGEPESDASLRARAFTALADSVASFSAQAEVWREMANESPEEKAARTERIAKYLDELSDESPAH